MGYRIPTPRSKYYIPKHEFIEVRHFCYRYQDMLEEQRILIMSGVKAITYDGMPHGSNVHDPTEEAGIRLADIGRNIRVIENTAEEIGGSLYKWLLKGVTVEGMTYYRLKMQHNIPCSEMTYRRMRQRFYHRLSKKMAFL